MGIRAASKQNFILKQMWEIDMVFFLLSSPGVVGCVTRIGLLPRPPPLLEEEEGMDEDEEVATSPEEVTSSFLCEVEVMGGLEEALDDGEDEEDSLSFWLHRSSAPDSRNHGGSGR